LCVALEPYVVRGAVVLVGDWENYFHVGLRRSEEQL
jgi:hypothetical protein